MMTKMGKKEEGMVRGWRGEDDEKEEEEERGEGDVKMMEMMVKYK